MGFALAQAYLSTTISEQRSPHDLARLDRMALLLKELGNPHLAYPTLHVGGTSGKGSTSTMIAAALTAAGHRTGLHAKPHLSSIVERMRIDGRPVYEDRLAVLLSLIRPVLDEITPFVGRPTYFETLLALAFVHFFEEKVDVAVIEVGLGGVLDGTNLVQPLVSVITNVGLDHQEILGETIEEIATDKAGIAKPNTPMVSAAVGAARQIIERVSREQHAPFFSVHDLTEVVCQRETSQGQSFTIKTQSATYDIGTMVLGGFQRINAATAVLALEQLPDSLRPTHRYIEDGFARLVIPGRMELVPAHPSILFDIAHNPDKMRGLADGLRTLFAQRWLHFVIAIADTKEVEPMLAALQDLPASYVFTSFEASGRTAMRPDRLASYVISSGAWIRVIEDPVEAFGVARRSAGADDLVVVTGSTVLVGVIRAWWTANMRSSTA